VILLKVVCENCGAEVKCEKGVCPLTCPRCGKPLKRRSKNVI